MNYASAEAWYLQQGVFMFGHESKPSRIYSFGALAPHEGANLVSEQILLAHRYRNALIEQERKRRDQVAALLREHFPDIERLEKEVQTLGESIEEIRTAIKTVNAKSRNKTVTREQRAKIQSLQAERKAAYVDLKARKAAAWSDAALQERLAEVDVGDAARRKELRANCSVHWGSYLTIEQGLQGIRRGAPPQFRRWDGQGKVAVQLQGGLNPAKAMLGLDNRLRIEITNGARKKPHAVAWLRVGSEGRNPVWAKVRFVLHRPFPSDCQIKWAYLSRRRIATQERWSLQFVLARPEWPREDNSTSGTVGVDVGWRVMKDVGLRVASWVGDDGAEGELVIPKTMVSRWHKARELQSIRDVNFDAIRARLGMWLASHEHPDWLKEKTPHLPQWKSPARLAAVVIAWREQRFDGDEEIFAAIETWRKQDRHLYDWQGFQQTGAIRWREDYYRKFVADLQQRYRTVAIEDLKLAKMLRTPASEKAPSSDEDSEKESQDSPLHSVARFNARIASAGRLLELLREGFTEVKPVPAQYTTQRCHACGEVEKFDASAEVVHQCSHCGTQWDQDASAAKILLAIALGNREPVARE